MTSPIKHHRDALANPFLGCLREFRSALADWFLENGRDLPWRTEPPRDPYGVLVSEMMLQQTQVATVIAYFRRWMERFPDVRALAAAPENDVLHAWQGLGYYSRARNLHAAARALVRENGGVFPREVEALRALPGIGPYTAAAIATFAFDEPVPPVDANIIRVTARLLDFRKPADDAAGGLALRSAAQAWQPCLEEGGAGLFNEALMELGALVCTPRAPRCHDCPVRLFCQAEEPETLPLKRPRPKTVEMEEHCGWIVQEGRVLLEQQTGKRWRGLWRLPLLTEPHSGQPLASLYYPFTHHRVHLCVFPGTTPLFLAENQRWFTLAELEAAPMPAPHRRALQKLLAEDNG
ncbi:MAG: A/G-specific adenine glycosylase [Chthoniobacteraceae bacterium]|nr:A/G-specific adenine glycosylase [Chthoniobacteraceae bacterium]